MDRFRALLLALAICLGLAAPALAQVGPSPHARVRLVAESKAAAPGSNFWVAVVLDQDPGWHTYWRNPGDAGEATQIAWTLPDGWRAGSIVWPLPRRLPLGPIMNYGYEGRAVLPVQVSIPAGARPGSVAHLSAKVDYLICAEVCVPGEAVAQLDLPVAAGSAPANPEGHALIHAALASTPRAGLAAATFQASGRTVRLSVAGAALSGPNVKDAYFFPYQSDSIDQAKPQTVERGPRGVTLTLTPGAAFTGKTPSQLSGALVIDGQGYDVSASAGAPLAGASGLASPTSAPSGALGLWLAMAYAFVGGLILNLMPCVFPILSMKAAALAGHSEDRSQARIQALAFLGGVVVSFLALAGGLLALRAAGSAVGWGFQLQSPTLVALLALVMLAAALNLSGLFEIGASLQGLGGGLASRGGAIGAVFTGVLAVVVAAPCTAPFMGPALGYALTQPAAFALAVFLALGLGFAAPFTLVAFTPALIRLLPRPGAWMSIFRKAMAFPMYAAAAWLAWVLAQQSGSEGLARLFAAAVVLALAAWLFGLSQERRAAGGRAPALGGAALVTLVGAGLVAAAPLPASTVKAQPWSPQAVAQARAAGHPVLVNFTAAWCVTCQVNERVAFSTPSVARAFSKANAVYLVGDWTNRDAAIGQALQAQGRIGVPLYLLYDARGDAPAVLPQLLTPQIVERAIERASSGKG
ncbi:MAG TPA: thioredoxin family protein [Caulobacteraceae bacterium]|jgi:thiol:disulfide interchange protein|nr:thioredoxin family protein [Caulobacteraceae bacterium]